MPLFPIAEHPADAGGDNPAFGETPLRLESLRPVVENASEGGPFFRQCLKQQKH